MIERIKFKLQWGNPPAWIPEWIHTLVYKLDNAAWAFRHNFVPKHQYNIIKTDLPAGYYDVDTLMEAALVTLLRRYVEDERGGLLKLAAHRNWLAETDDVAMPVGSQIKNCDEIIAVYQWFVIDKPKLNDAYDMAIQSWVEANDVSPMFTKLDNSDHYKMTPWVNGKDHHDHALALEKQIDETTDMMLPRLVNARHGMWV